LIKDQDCYGPVIHPSRPGSMRCRGNLPKSGDSDREALEFTMASYNYTAGEWNKDKAQASAVLPIDLTQ
jgi:hypothetical protein